MLSKTLIRVPVVCPDCGVHTAGSPSGSCVCGYEQPLAFVIPYEAKWTYEPDLESTLRRHAGLRLMGKFVGKNPEHLATLTHVEYLYLSRYPSFRFEWLKRFDGLSTLALDYASITSTEGVEELKALRSLDFIECRRLEDLAGVEKLTKLRLLRISICNRLQDFAPVAGCRELVAFWFEGKTMENLEFLRGLDGLRVAILNGRVESRDLSPLDGLSLTRLVAKPRAFPKADLERYAAAHPRCQVERI